MSDKLVFDLAQEVEGSPNVFIRKDWINILDNQNQNYNNNQSIIDTSQLSNSNKYMSYREAYLSVPFLITLAQTDTAITISNAVSSFDPATAATSADYAIGLKNWFGQVIHSLTLDYNGTTIIQQTPFCNMWNSFKLMTSLSLDDINTQGATIGFYPDDPLTWSYNISGSASVDGNGTCNNTNYIQPVQVSSQYNSYKSDLGNEGFLRRQQLINFDNSGVINNGIPLGAVTYSDLLDGNALNNCWKSYISNKVNYSGPLTFGSASLPTERGVIQYSVVATIYLKHIHSFFNMCPLLKGVFMKMTMALNNASSTIVALSTTTAGGVATTSLTCTAVSNPVGGVNPIMIASAKELLGNLNGGSALFGVSGATLNSTITNTYIANISVGASCLNNNITSSNRNVTQGALSKSVYLYIPAYTFNPVFEQAYLSSPVKPIRYTDIYQYQVLKVNAGSTFTNLLTNGIANVKSVLVIPFFNTELANSNFIDGIPVYQSPFDPAGTGPTSPMCWLTNFNVQVSGQNAIYNTEKYNFEQFNNQLYGQNAVNGGLTDGITSGLIDRQAFDMEYCYYYVNVERMLPVEQSVAKSIQILGQNMSRKALDLWCFVEYGNEVSVDILTGARV